MPAAQSKFYFTLDHILETPLVYNLAKTFLQLDPLLNCEATGALNIAALDEAHGNYEDALHAAEHAIKVDPLNADAYMQRGFICHALNRPQDALASFEKVVEVAPHYKHGYGWTMLGLHLNRLERYGRAINAFEKALKYDPDAVYALNGLATALYFQKRYLEARNRLAHALKQPNQTDGLHAELRCNLGLVFLQLDAPKKALYHFGVATQTQPKLVKAWCGKAEAFIQLGAFQEAHKAASQALAFEPDNIAALESYGAALCALSRYPEALTIYDRLLKNDSKNATAWSERGAVLAKLNRASEAIESCQRAVDLNGQESKYWLNYGAVFEKLEQHVSACDCYQRAIVFDPQQLLAWNKLGSVKLRLCQIALQKDQTDEAAKHWQEAVGAGRKGKQDDWFHEEFSFVHKLAQSGQFMMAYQITLELAGNPLLIPMQHALHYLQTRDMNLLAKLPPELQKETEKIISQL